MLNIPAGVNNISRIPAPICTWLTTDDFRAFIWFLVLFIIYGLINLSIFLTDMIIGIEKEHGKRIIKERILINVTNESYSVEE